MGQLLQISHSITSREIIVTTVPCRPKGHVSPPIFWLAENKEEVDGEGHKYTCCIFMSQFPVEPAAKCIFGFHFTYPFLLWTAASCVPWGILFLIFVGFFTFTCSFEKSILILMLVIYTLVISPPKDMESEWYRGVLSLTLCLYVNGCWQRT